MRDGLRCALFRFVTLSAALVAVVIAAGFLSALAHATEYRVTLAPVKDPLLDKALQGSSTLIELQAAPPDDITALRRRAQEDLNRLRKALRSAGYYDGDVAIAVDGQPVADAASSEPTAAYDNSNKKVVAVKIAVTPGPLYKLRTVTITGSEKLKQKLTLTLKSGMPARAADIVAERNRLLSQTMGQGYPFALVDLQPAIVDHASDTLDVTFAVDPGQYARIGRISVKGLAWTDPAFIAKRTAAARGKPYRPATIDALRGDLRSLDIFSSVKVIPAAAADPDGTLPVDIEVEERERHFIGFGANYSTNDGAGGTVYWGDRNLFGGGERLRLQADLAGIDQNGLDGADYTLSGSFRTPDFLTRHQDFLADLSVTDEHDPDTFDKKGVNASIGIERTFGKSIKINYGWEAETSRITDNHSTSDFVLTGPMGGANYDTTDDLLNPTKGVRLTFNGEALPTWFGSNENVFATKTTASTYLNLSGKGDLVLAGRLAVANVFGSSLQDIPADRRLYAGGGGSVRGYTYRSISPKDGDGDLSGGRSQVDGSIELRYRFLGDFGIVPFFDAGTVSRNAAPSFDEGLQYAAGIGFRYYTAFGPIRADIATPLNPRKHDDPVAFYVSIGQAF